MSRSQTRTRAPLPPTAVVFSGTRRIVEAQFQYIDNVMDNLKANIFITGGCVGVDTYVGEHLTRRFPRARHIVVVPYNYRWNTGHIFWMEEHGAEVLDMPKPPKSEKKHPNLLRNEYMLDLAKELAGERAKLVAFPGGPIEVLRSGTWSTIRQAGHRQMEFAIYPLSFAEGTLASGVQEQ